MSIVLSVVAGAVVFVFVFGTARFMMVQVRKAARKPAAAEAGTWATATAGVSVDEALRLMKPTPRVTEEVKAALATELPGVCGSVAEVAGMSPLVLASRLIGMQFVDEDDLVGIARDLVAAFRDMSGSGTAQAGDQAPAAAVKPPAEKKAAPGEAGYRALLIAASTGREKSMSGTIRPGATVIGSFSTMSGSVHLEGTVVLEDSSTMSGDITGTAYVPAGVRFSTMSGSKRVTVHAMTWEALARQAKLT